MDDLGNDKAEEGQGGQIVVKKEDAGRKYPGQKKNKVAGKKIAGFLGEFLGESVDKGDEANPKDSWIAEVVNIGNGGFKIVNMEPDWPD